MPEFPAGPARATVATLPLLLLDQGGIGRRLIGLLLERLGHPNPAVAADTEAALAALASSPHHAVLVDLGGQTPAAVASLAAGSTARLIAVVGAADDAIEAACRTAGAHVVLRKPLSLAAIAAALEPIGDEDDFDAATWADLRRLYAGDGLRELIAAIGAELPIQQQRHAAAEAANDLPALARVVHTLRGSCLQFGAANLAALAARAEQAARDGDAAPAWTASAELVRRHARLVAKLQRKAGDGR